eukprot:scaffold2.g7156.t1
MSGAPGPSLPFSGVEDSPLFRTSVAELEAGVESLKQRGQRFVKDSRKLCEGLDAEFAASSAFADALERFCGTLRHVSTNGAGTDEESMLLGGPLLLKFVSTFRELASFQDLLRTQLEVVLCERLNHSLSALLTEERECRRRAERGAGAYDAARLRHLGHKSASHVSTWSKSNDPERTQGDMLAAKAEADAARYDLARKLVEIEGQKRHMFLDAMVTGMDAYLRHFERALALFQTLSPYLAHSLDVVEKLRAEAGAQAAALENLIAAHQADEAAAREAAAAAGSEPGGGGGAAAGRPAGPLQMTAGTSALASEMETNKERTSGREGKPQNTVSLLTATVKPDAEDPSLRYAFRRVVISPEKELTLQAESASDAQEWMQAIQSVIACLLGGALAAAELPSQPRRPTHTRTSSGMEAGSLASLALGEGPLGGGLAAAASASASAASARGAAAAGAEGRDPSVSSLPPAAPPRPPSAAGAVEGWALGATGAGVVDILRQAGAADALCHWLLCCGGGSGSSDAAGCRRPQSQLGVLLCISCSGTHRRLGVHVWEPSIVQLFQLLGNDFANSVWEARLQTPAPGLGAAAAVGQQGAARHTSLQGGGPGSSAAAGSGPPRKPGPSAGDAQRAEFIVAKYVDRAFVAAPAPGPAAAAAQQLADWLWEAVQRGDVRGAFRALAAGANVNTRYSSQPAAQLVWESNLRAGGADDQPVSPSNLGGVTALHAACRTGSPLLVELLVQSGASVDATDVFRRSPLHYAVLYDAAGERQRETEQLQAPCTRSVPDHWSFLSSGLPPLPPAVPEIHAPPALAARAEVAKLLLRRQASSSRDREGLTPAQLAAAHPCGRDTELLALLREAEKRC